MYPLDVVKTRQQLNTGLKGDGILLTLTNIVRKEGHVSHSPGADRRPWRLYRGMLPPMMMEAPKRAVKCGFAPDHSLCPVGANGFFGNVFTDNGRRPMTQALSFGTGFAAGSVESLVVVPFELVKIRLQDKSSTFKGPWDVVKHSWRVHGPLGWATNTTPLMSGCIRASSRRSGDSRCGIQATLGLFSS